MNDSKYRPLTWSGQDGIGISVKTGAKNLNKHISLKTERSAFPLLLSKYLPVEGEGALG